MIIQTLSLEMIGWNLTVVHNVISSFLEEMSC